MIHTPSNLELLLHCYYSSQPHPRLDTPAIQEGILYLDLQGMIKHDYPKENVFSVTSKGKAYIEFLMDVPFPEQHWIVPMEVTSGTGA